MEKPPQTLDSLLQGEKQKGIPWVLGPILRFYGQEASVVFPGVGDVFDAIIPPTDLGSWFAMSTHFGNRGPRKL